MLLIQLQQETRMAAAHEFALSVDTIPAGLSWSITDSAIIHRMRTVLRARVDDTVVFFSDREYTRASIKNISDRAVVVELANRTPITALAPEIDLVLPFLERAAFEEAVSAATVLGVRRIIVVRTQKSAPSPLSPNFRERLHRIMIAAAEQSKQYCLPLIDEAPNLTAALSAGVTPLFFHPTGMALSESLPVLESISRLCVVVGPAGDLSTQEQKSLAEAGAFFIRLTPTILRSEAAVMVGVGVLRSVLQPRQP